MNHALSVIKDEHRSLAAVIHGMRFLVKEIRDRGAEPRFPLFRAMIYYIDSFSERFHHPKEDRYLFAAVRARSPALNQVLEELEQQHAEGREHIKNLERALLRYEEGGPGERAQFEGAVETFAQFHWDHMRLEEDVLMPGAQDVLTAEDWKLIDAAFSDHTDPLLGIQQDREFQQLFSRIVMMAPPPIGVGPESSGAKAD